MKIIAPLIAVAALLGGCAVVPAGRPVVYGPPPMVTVAPPVYVAPAPPVVVVPSRPYYGGHYGRRGYWR